VLTEEKLTRSAGMRNRRNKKLPTAVYFVFTSDEN
jgi:hypothetical protein